MDWEAFIKILPQLGAAAVVALAIGGLFFYVLRYTIPSLQKVAEDERKEFHSALSRAMDVNQKQAQDFHTSLQQVQVTMLQQQSGFLLALSEERNAHIKSSDSLAVQLGLVTKEIREQTVSLTTVLRERR